MKNEKDDLAACASGLIQARKYASLAGRQKALWKANNNNHQAGKLRPQGHLFLLVNVAREFQMFGLLLRHTSFCDQFILFLF